MKHLFMLLLYLPKLSFSKGIIDKSSKILLSFDKSVILCEDTLLPIS